MNGAAKRPQVKVGSQFCHLPTVYKPQFLHLENGDNSTDLAGLS